MKGIIINKDNKGNPISATIDLTIHQALFDKFFSAVILQEEPVNQPVSVMPSQKGVRRDATIFTVLTSARGLLGKPHLSKATSGIDCSGLSSSAFNAAGIKIPRSSTEQAKFGTPVDRNNLEAGDLVFFATDDKRPTVVTHVGIVTQGADKGEVRMIHASTSRGVVEERLFSDYYSKRYLNAMRVV